jgi:hypothetical protein
MLFHEDVEEDATNKNPAKSAGLLFCGAAL